MTPLRERLDELASSVTGGDALDGASLYRQSMARARRRRVLSVGAAAVVAVAVGTVVPVIGTDEDATTEPLGPSGTTGTPDPPTVPGTCPVGAERAVYSALPQDKPTSVLLGCARLDDGRRIELLSLIRAGGLCLQIVGIDDRVRECGNAPSEQVPAVTRAVAAQAIAQRNGSARLEVYGAVSADVTAVNLTYTVGGASRGARAELIQVTDDDALEAAGIRRPFGYFLAELPPDTSDVSVVAGDAEGQPLGADDFAPYLQTQPRDAFVSGPSQ